MVQTLYVAVVMGVASTVIAAPLTPMYTEELNAREPISIGPGLVMPPRVPIHLPPFISKVPQNIVARGGGPAAGGSTPPGIPGVPGAAGSGRPVTGGSTPPGVPAGPGRPAGGSGPPGSAGGSAPGGPRAGRNKREPVTIGKVEGFKPRIGISKIPIGPGLETVPFPSGNKREPALPLGFGAQTFSMSPGAKGIKREPFKPGFLGIGKIPVNLGHETFAPVTGIKREPELVKLPAGSARPALPEGWTQTTETFVPRKGIKREPEPMFGGILGISKTPLRLGPGLAMAPGMKPSKREPLRLSKETMPSPMFKPVDWTRSIYINRREYVMEELD